ncbi:MAG: prepilin-type N-terminal cleavage/methylation domain-containing protein [Nitrospirota bacterium]
MKDDGFTLIEVILIIVIMAIVIPGLIAGVSYMTASQVNLLGTTTAANLAQEELEKVIAKKMSTCGTCGYANITVGAGTFSAVTGFPNYEKKTDVEMVDSGLNPSGTDLGYKKVTITVRAVGVGPSVPNAVLVSLLTNY